MNLTLHLLTVLSVRHKPGIADLTGLTIFNIYSAVRDVGPGRMMVTVCGRR